MSLDSPHPPPDLRYGFSPDERARLRDVCAHSLELIQRAREAVARSATLLGRASPGVTSGG